MWVTKDGHRLGILVPRLHALALRAGLPAQAVADEIGRTVRLARYGGTIQRPRRPHPIHRPAQHAAHPPAHHPVFVARSHPRARRLVTKAVPPGPRRRALPWWPRRPFWPWGYWPDYAVIGVEPVVVDASGPLVEDPSPDDAGDAGDGDAAPPLIADPGDERFDAWVSDLDLGAPFTLEDFR